MYNKIDKQSQYETSLKIKGFIIQRKFPQFIARRRQRMCHQYDCNNYF